MRFSIQDVKKSVQRRGGELTVALHFLRPGELTSEIERLVAYHEAFLGKPQRTFSFDEARACVGDYRLANCLLATLSRWYNWRSREWEEAVRPLHANVAEISSSLHLRLALFDFVNEHFEGFLDSEMREVALQALAETYQIGSKDLEYLLALDSEGETVLVREQATPPTVQDVATLYNQWVFEAALFNASDVHFTIDCAAFSRAQQQGDGISSGVGMVIKRLCYLARLLGVYYDLAYLSAPAGQGELLSAGTPAQLSLTLYGPQEVTGAPQQYGLRLARLCRLLLGYGISANAQTRRRSTLSTAIIEAQATVHFLQRSYTFIMDAPLLQLLPTPQAAEQSSPPQSDGNQLFDSSIEQRFSEAFSALARSQAVDGWHLEREPEPLLLEQSIFIPDFALTRAQRRIYVEILGFWTPAYRERKIHKLQQLRERDDLVLAIPVEARAAFASIADDFPIVYYDGQLSVSELLQVLRNRYDDFAERLERIDGAVLRARIQNEGLLPEPICYRLLFCYRRSELQSAAEHVLDASCRFLPGLGICSLAWLERFQDDFQQWLRASGSQALEAILRFLPQRWPVLASCEAVALETLIEQCPDVRINRDSIFEARVELAEVIDDATSIKEEFKEEPIVQQESKKREKRAPTRKRSKDAPTTTQGDLWGE